MHTNCDVSHRTNVLLYDLNGSARFCLFTISCTFYVLEIKVKQTNKQHTHTHKLAGYVYTMLQLCKYNYQL